MKRMRSQQGAALLETAIVLPMIMLVCVGIFEFGRAYQTWQVLSRSDRRPPRGSP
jgi:Flp pilus assembly protein TadG